MSKKKLTPVQLKLFEELETLISPVNSESFEVLKRNTSCETFDSTFNALLFKGWVSHDRKSWKNHLNKFFLGES